MRDIFEDFKRFVNNNNLINKNDSVIIGISGGADSVCLLKLLERLSKQMKFIVVGVHINHNLRGEEALKDQQFVADLMEKCGFAHYEYSFDVEKIAKEKKQSVEEVARELRYSAFEKIGKKYKNYKIAVAHNANDNAETILHNLIRGTGIKGATGISVVRNNIIRPLIKTTRDEIIEYLELINQEYRTDLSNMTDDYTRNKIRNNVIPYMKENINDKVVEHINVFGDQLKLADEFLNKIIDKSFDKYINISKSLKSDQDNAFFIPENEFKKEEEFIKKEIVKRTIELMAGKLKDITFIHIQNVLELFDKSVGKIIELPYNLVAIKEYDGVVLKTKSQKKQEKENYIKVNGEGVYEKEGINGKFIIEIIDKEMLNNNKINLKNNSQTYTKYMDYDILNGDLFFRNRKMGDYFITNSKGDKKKLKDYFIDQKVPREKRDEIILMANGNKVCWIVGYRISEDCKITDNTKKILKITYEKEENNDGNNN